MATQDVQQLIDKLAARLQRSVTVTDPEIRIIAASAHYGDEDEARVRAVLARVALPEVYRHIHSFGVRNWTAPGVIPAQSALGFKQRFVVPVRRGSTLLALLMVIDEHASDTDASGSSPIEGAAHALSSLLDTEHEEQQRQKSRRSQLLADLLSDHPCTRDRAVAEAAEVLGAQAEHAVMLTMVLGTRRATVTDHLELIVDAGMVNVQMREGSQLAYDLHGRTATIASLSDRSPSESEIRAHAQRLRHSALSLLEPDWDAVIGISGASVDLTSLRAAHRRAQLAAEAATLLPQFAPVASYSDLGVFATLLRLPVSDLDDAIPTAVHRLHENDSHGVHLETLRAYLDAAGSIPVTSQRLNLHRTSLYYRLNQIEKVVGTSLRDGTTRLALHLGLEAMRLQQARNSRPD